MVWMYSVFGLKLRSSEALPGLESVAANFESPDVEVRFCEQPEAVTASSERRDSIAFTSSIVTATGEPGLRIWEVADGVLLRLDYADGSRFWLDRAGTKIWGMWPQTSSLEDVATYVLGPVLGYLLRLRGVTCLHASAVELGNLAFAFVGAEGAGKSTTAAALAERGHSVVSDDIVALAERDGVFFANPAYPYMSLWSDSVKMLYGPEKNVPSFSANYDKRQLLLADHHLKFQAKPMQLGAICLLGERTAEDSGPIIEEVPKPESFLTLVANSYATNLIDANTRAKEFELLGRLVKTVPVLRLRAHRDAKRIGLLCELIERRGEIIRMKRHSSVDCDVA